MRLELGLGLGLRQRARARARARVGARARARVRGTDLAVGAVELRVQVVQAGHADVGERELAELREAVGRRLERAEDGGGRRELEQAVGAEHGHEAHLVRG